LPEEPAEGDPEVTTVVFRYPDGNRRAERRFLKSNKVKVLYDYVDSLGSEVLEESDKYELIQSFPFTVYRDFDKTLEEEKLYPNAMLQIKEL
jgi:hypothetical protein